MLAWPTENVSPDLQITACHDLETVMKIINIKT